MTTPFFESDDACGWFATATIILIFAIISLFASRKQQLIAIIGSGIIFLISFAINYNNYRERKNEK